MARRLFTLLSALSLLLLAAVVVLWARGYSGMDDVGWYTVRWPDPMNRDRREYQLRSVHGFWVLSYVRNDFRLAFPGDIVNRLAQPGELERFREQNPTGTRFYHRRLDDEGLRPYLAHSVPPHNWLGFDYDQRVHANRGWTDTYRQWAVPVWLPLALALVAPSAWLARHIRRRRRLGRNLCARCGYDLRATPGRCPECGAVPAKKYTCAAAPLPSPAPRPAETPPER